MFAKLAFVAVAAVAVTAQSDTTPRLAQVGLQYKGSCTSDVAYMRFYLNSACQESACVVSPAATSWDSTACKAVKPTYFSAPIEYLTAGKKYVLQKNFAAPGCTAGNVFSGSAYLSAVPRTSGSTTLTYTCKAGGKVEVKTDIAGGSSSVGTVATGVCVQHAPSVFTKYICFVRKLGAAALE
eukprot:TRINITY_DN5058_c0_g1_i2.p2 TRINITY_DN5058_c0_g1~~TRINITY_DN5058_c0_g1_i2.p2  ORF type:complete len:182 (+),score=29.26 TRINITY_DN5058_c0_g1_i2:213-758(+)